MAQITTESMGERRFQLILLGIFAVVALALGAVGIYGVMAYSVEQRTRELGVRVALGATGSRVIGLVVREGLILAGIGIAVGAVGSYFLRQTIESFLYNVGALDPTTYAAVVGVLVSVAGLACFVPARRAAAIDPIEALRAE